MNEIKNEDIICLTELKGIINDNQLLINLIYEKTKIWKFLQVIYKCANDKQLLNYLENHSHIENIELNKISFIQEYFFKDRLISENNINIYSRKSSIILLHFGESDYYIPYEGNHRILRSILNKKTSITCKVINIPYNIKIK